MKPGTVTAFHGPDRFLFEQAFREARSQWISPENADFALVKLSGAETDGNQFEEEVITPAFGSPVKIIHLDAYLKIKDKKHLFEVLGKVSDHCLVLLSWHETNVASEEVKTFFRKTPDVRLVLAEAPRSKDIKKRIRDRLSLENIRYGESALNELADYLSREPDLFTCEMEKLVLFLKEGEQMEPKHVENLKATSHPVNVFHLVRAFMARKEKETMHHFLSYLHDGGSLIYLQTLLFYEALKLYQFQEALAWDSSEQDAFRIIGAYHMRMKNSLKSQSALFSLTETAGLLNVLGDLERLLKSESIVDESRDGQRVNLAACGLLLKIIHRYTR